MRNILILFLLVVGCEWSQAHKKNPLVPAFSSESYPGWLTHWKEALQKPDSSGILQEVDYLLSHKHSFNLYVVHGGANFGWTAGANAFSPVQYQPDVTSYDYDAPISKPHDYALVFLNGKLMGTIFRDGGKWTVQLPKTDVKDPVLEILVEGMGHINFAQHMIDRKGVTDPAS